MLTHLNIHNYALIDELDIELNEGLTVITGETGSGKSIILGALQFLCGAKLNAGINSSNDKIGKTYVEAIFKDVCIDLPEDLSEDISGQELILRREITFSGRSRAFINDTPVSLGRLAEVAQSLLDIHSQNSNTKILTSEFQLNLLDNNANITALRDEYTDSFRQYVKLRREVSRLKEKAEEAHRNEEMLRFRYEELKDINPLRGEVESLEARCKLLSNAGRIASAFNESVNLIDTSDISILSSLSRINEALAPLPQGIIPPDIRDRLKSVYLELRDISDTLSQKLNTIEENPAELEHTENRLTRLYDASRRYKLDNPDELADLFDDIKNQLKSLDSDNSELKKLEAEARSAGKKLQFLADQLSEARAKSAKILASHIEDKARPIGLPNLVVEIKVERSKLTPYGQDNVVICCGFNKNQFPMPLAQRASGGEMSRLMLAIKAMEVASSAYKTIIFDEIDTGVSGSIAELMGRLMKEIAKEQQVISITHLPQVAAQGNQHFKVYKEDNTETTNTFIKVLDDDARIQEIANMLSGTIVSDASIQNAREMLNKDK